MKATRKGITAALSVITALPLLAPAGRRMGLLPLLLYNSGGGGGLLQIMERASGKTTPPVPGEAAQLYFYFKMFKSNSLSLPEYRSVLGKIAMHFSM